MDTCQLCGEVIQETDKQCRSCGTIVAIKPSEKNPPGANERENSSPAPAGNETSAPLGSERICNSCGKVYGAEFQDEFCECGSELSTLPAHGLAATTPNAAPELSPQIPPLSSTPEARQKPASGSNCLVTYSIDRKPIHHFVIDKDVTIIGRNDPVRNVFVDLDFSEVLEPELARKVSRRHAMVLRSRENLSMVFRPMEGNTGTQIEGAIAEAGQDYPLTDGTRIILGGTVRIKFEITP